MDTENQDPCTCSEEAREQTGIRCTPEIQMALRLGYTLKKIYEVYHWEETSQYDPTTRQGELFAQYNNTFLKFKQEASGPLTGPLTYRNMHRNRVFRENIVKNPGLRALAKLFLIVFWASLVSVSIGDRLSSFTNFRPSCFSNCLSIH